MSARKGPPAGVCIVRVTRMPGEGMLINVTAKLDVTSADGRSSHQVLDSDQAVELVREFLQQWQCRETQ